MSTIDASQAVPATDGVLMATDVYLPERLPAPAVLTRTPYGRCALLANGVGWARNGFAYVAQDVRGRYGSEGTWTPYQHEHSDGQALVDWVHGQAWCDGNVILAGASYGSFTAWASALAAPGRIRAVISEVPAAGMRQANVDPSGVLRLAEHVSWWTTHAEARTSRNGLSAQMLRAHPELLRHLPVADLGRHLWARLPRWWSSVQNATGPHQPPNDDELACCPVPALHIGGWYDLFLPQTLRQWESAGRDHRPRPARGLVIGPWRHELSTPQSSAVGGREHGPDSQLPLGQLQVEWISDVLAGRDASITKVFLLEGKRWLDHWPASTSTLRLHAAADGSLSLTGPDRAAEHHVDYDPLDPYPSLPRYHDRASLDSRTDVAVFRTSAITAPITVVGAPTVRLTVSTTAPCADWVVRLVQRCADGRVLDIASGVTVAGAEAHVVHLELTATALVLVPGSRMELHVTSSDFPYLARNLNTGLDRYTTSATRTATQTVHSGPVHGCWVDLPVMECA